MIMIMYCNSLQQRSQYHYYNYQYASVSLYNLCLLLAGWLRLLAFLLRPGIFFKIMVNLYNYKTDTSDNF